MSETINIIIEIPKNDFKKLVNPYQHNEVWCNRLKRMVMNGTPLEEELHREKEQAYYLGYEDGRKALIDDVKAEIAEILDKISAEIKNMEYHMVDCDVLVSQEEVLDIIDKYKGDSE